MTFCLVQSILNFSMIKYIKSFSQGQITIPKEFREELGLANEFWLKLQLVNQAIVAEPMERKVNRKEYLKKLQKIKGDWFDMKDYRKIRQEFRKRQYE